MAAKKKASSKIVPSKKKVNQPPRPASLKEGGRFNEGYGPSTPIGNPGAGIYRRQMASDFIRPPLTMKKSSGKKK